MQRIIWYPLMSILLIGVPGQAMWGANLDDSYAFYKPAHPIDVAQTTREMNEEAAFKLVWNLPQVQYKARTIQRLSRGAIKVAAIVDGLPTPDDPYYKVRVYEDQPDHNSTIYWFRVSKTGVIEALDVIENKYVSLKEWQEQIRRRR
ncbi:hypothetical protein [Nostoc sp. MS1]|uniref:hypothetical protein n=1 Tax=Nostoc sp. MS1 TaxID=2764711 RepID=UPI001CC34582|nr:hypothetical protein [Nostoc sp. MS1]BCL34453.1 hypothetical protein NSMS1_09000 [Nostoc sp. MS1]